MAALDKLISDRFFDDVEGLVNPESGVIPLNACVVVEYIDADGEHKLATGFSDDMTFYAKEGMCRTLLRDAMMLPLEAERREAIDRFDGLDDD